MGELVLDIESDTVGGFALELESCLGGVVEVLVQELRCLSVLRPFTELEKEVHIVCGLRNVAEGDGDSGHGVWWEM